MSNFGAPPYCNFFFGNPGPYNIDFKFNHVNMPAGYGYQMPQGQGQQSYPAVQYPVPDPHGQTADSGFYSCQSRQSQGRPCDRHQNFFCMLPECRSGLEESTASNFSGSGGGGITSNSWSYTTPTQSQWTSTPASLGTPIQSSFETPIRGFQTLPFHSNNSKYEQFGGGNDSWASSGGGGSGHSSSNQSLLACFSPKNCNIT